MKRMILMAFGLLLTGSALVAAPTPTPTLTAQAEWIDGNGAAQSIGPCKVQTMGTLAKAEYKLSDKLIWVAMDCRSIFGDGFE